MQTTSARAEASASGSTVFFPNLDALRFLAFFAVYINHGFGYFSALLREVPVARDTISDAAGLGVRFFFTLSGFLITYLILAEIDRTGHLDIEAFYVRRALRIWPLYYLVILFCLAIYPALKSLLGLGAYLEMGNAFYYVFFLSNFDVINLGPGRGAGMTGVTWSVAVEEQFYLAWPLLFALLKPRKHWLIFPTVIVISLLFRGWHSGNEQVLYFHSVSVISDMAVGGLLAYLSLRSQRFVSMIKDLPRGAIIAIYGTGAFLIVARKVIFAASLLPAVERLAVSCFFAFVILEQNCAARSPLKLGHFRILSQLGKYTYGLYLLHEIVLTMMDGVSRFFGIKGSGAVFGGVRGCVGLALSITVSYISYRWYEKPFLLLKERFARVRSGSGPLASGTDREDSNVLDPERVGSHEMIGR
jgi:peptidoglycan/LPS O-acetylase OafA/YrhL